MVQGRERLRLALESGQAIQVRGERIRQHLERNLAAETGIGGAIDRTHPAFADPRGDFIDAKTRAESESQAVGL